MTVHTATQETPREPKPGPYILSPVRHEVDWMCEERLRGGLHQCEQPPYMYNPVIAPRVQQSNFAGHITKRAIFVDGEEAGNSNPRHEREAVGSSARFGWVSPVEP